MAITTSEMIFVKDSQSGNIYAAKESWFERISLCETYTNYGQEVECQKDEEGDCCCPAVDAYNYWNGSNYKSIITWADGFDTDYSEISDEEEIAALRKAIEEMEESGTATGIEYYKGNGYEIKKSIWQGDWELYELSLAVEEV